MSKRYGPEDFKEWDKKHEREVRWRKVEDVINTIMNFITIIVLAVTVPFLCWALINIAIRMDAFTLIACVYVLLMVGGLAMRPGGRR